MTASATFFPQWIGDKPATAEGRKRRRHSPPQPAAARAATASGQSLYAKRISVIRTNILSLSNRVVLVMTTLMAYLIGARIVNSRSPVVAFGVVLVVYLAVVLVEMLISEEMSAIAPPSDPQAPDKSGSSDDDTDAAAADDSDDPPVAAAASAPSGSIEALAIRRYQLNLVASIKGFAENLFGVVITILVDTTMLSSSLNVADALVLVMLIAIIMAIATVLDAPANKLPSDS